MFILKISYFLKLFKGTYSSFLGGKFSVANILVTVSSPALGAAISLKKLKYIHFYFAKVTSISFIQFSIAMGNFTSIPQLLNKLLVLLLASSKLFENKLSFFISDAISSLPFKIRFPYEHAVF